MKGMMRILALMIMFLSSANVIAVAGNTDPIGDITVTGENISNIDNKNLNNNLNNNANSNTNSNNNSNNNRNTLSVSAILPAAGFVTSQVGVNGPPDTSISLAIKAVFEEGFTRQEIEKALGEKKAKAKDDPLGLNTKTYPPTNDVVFVFSDRGSKPGPTSKRIDGGTIIVQAGEANIQRGLLSLGLKGMNKGGVIVYVSTRLKSKTESKNSAISIVGTLLNACTFGATGSLGISGGTVENSEDKVIMDYGFYAQVEAPVVFQQTDVETKVVTRSLPWWMEYALKGGKKHCPDKCINNACLRIQAAFDYALKGQWKKAENEAQIGQRDIAGGIEQDGTKTITLKAAPILAKVLRRIEMLSVREQFGRVSEVSLAIKYRSMYGDTSMPTEIEDLYKNF